MLFMHTLVREAKFVLFSVNWADPHELHDHDQVEQSFYILAGQACSRWVVKRKDWVGAIWSLCPPGAPRGDIGGGRGSWMSGKRGSRQDIHETTVKSGII